MNRANSALIASLWIAGHLLMWGPAARTCPGEDPATISGRTIAQYTALLDNPDRVVRLRAIKSLGAFGETAGKAITTSLDHDDAAMRYTAAVHLGRIGGKPLALSHDRLAELAADKQSRAVQMAASYALCEAGEVDKHLPLLIESLSYPERGMACCAAELIGRLGPDAVDAVDPLESVYAKHRPGAKGGDYHIGGASKNALRKIRGE